MHINRQLCLQVIICCRRGIMRAREMKRGMGEGNIRTAGNGRIGIGKTKTERIDSHQSPGCTYTHIHTSLLYKVSLSPPPPTRSSLTAMFHGIPPWERRVNKHLSFLAREATGRLKCLNLGAPGSSPAVLLLLSPLPPFLLHADSGTVGCPKGDARLRIMKIRMLDPGDGWIRSGTECNGSRATGGISSARCRWPSDLSIHS